MPSELTAQCFHTVFLLSRDRTKRCRRLWVMAAAHNQPEMPASRFGSIPWRHSYPLVTPRVQWVEVGVWLERL